MSDESSPLYVPGLARTNALKLWTKFGSANLLSPESKNSIPSAAWIKAEAASAAFPLAGIRRARVTGDTLRVVRSSVFITLIHAHFGGAGDPKSGTGAPEGRAKGIG